MDNNNDEGKQQEMTSKGLGLLLGLGLLGYAVYKVLTTPAEDDKSQKRLYASLVADIVNKNLVSTDGDDLGQIALYYALPSNYLTKLITDIDDEIYKNIMFRRIKKINEALLSLKDEYEGYYPNHGDAEIYSLIEFMKEDCYELIKFTKFFASLRSLFIGKLPGLGFVTNAKSAQLEFYVLNSIRKGLIAYFEVLFVDGGPVKFAKEKFMDAYFRNFNESVDLE